MSAVSFIYNAFIIPSAVLALGLLKKINPKIAERENSWLPALESADKLDDKQYSGKKRIWFHAASLGEFEQIKPVIEELRKKDNEIIIIVSFFSPSGFNVEKEYPFADCVLYLPFDTIHKSRLFIGKIKPDLAVFVRYEIWLNHLSELNKRHIPAILVCAARHQKDYVNSNYLMRRFYRTGYNSFKKIFTVGEYHTKYFKSLDLNPDVVTLTDPRLDRIVDKVKQSLSEPLLPASLLASDGFVLVAGSCWQPDEDLIIAAAAEIQKSMSSFLRIVFVPHEPNHPNLTRLNGRVPNNIMLSELLARIELGDLAELGEDIKFKHIIADSIGKLLRIYGIADAAYIGGGFGAGLHSVTEPAGYGIPIACGPKIEAQYDAAILRSAGALRTVGNLKELLLWLGEMIHSEETRKAAGEIARNYVNDSTGAAALLSEYLLRSLLGQNEGSL